MFTPVGVYSLNAVAIGGLSDLLKLEFDHENLRGANDWLLTDRSDLDSTECIQILWHDIVFLFVLYGTDFPTKP